jgi:hypothetical protein
MKQGFTYIALVLDRSGSMRVMREATVSAVNKFVAEQKKLSGECMMRLVQFDDLEYTVVFEKNMQDIGLLTQTDFQPRGMTPLLDAQGQTIVDVGKKLATMPEHQRPEKVIIVTMTDGLENASKEFTKERVATLVAHQRAHYGWEFLYLGANQDAIAIAAEMNIPRGSTMSYDASPTGMRNTMAATADYVSSVRSSSSGLTGQSVTFTDADREAAMKHGS